LTGISRFNSRERLPCWLYISSSALSLSWAPSTISSSAGLTDPFPQPGSFSASPAGNTGFRESARALLIGVEVNVHCGLHPWERHPERPNRLIIDVEMTSDWPVPVEAADGSPLKGYVDYDRVRNYLLSWQDRDHVDLLETLVDDLTCFIFDDLAVNACRVRILKPDIFAETAAAGVEVTRYRPGR